MNEQLSLLLGLGPNAEWPYTEKSLIEVINLQKEKEITKQQYYKLEAMNKSAALLNQCLQANIPPYLIPIVFSGEALNEDLIQKMISKQSEQPQVMIRAPSQEYPQRPLYSNHGNQQNQHAHAHAPTPPPHKHQGNSSSNLGPPVAFHRPLSPAKIGAAAVAQLEMRHRYPASPIHRRNQSMPANSPIPVPKISVASPSAYPAKQSSMMGTMSSIQFINETPGKLKRRRSSVEIPEEESEAEQSSITRPKFIKGHSRTRSDSALGTTERERERERKPADTPTREKARSPLVENNKDVSIPDKAKTQTSTIGPNFANNILSST